MERNQSSGHNWLNSGSSQFYLHALRFSSKVCTVWGEHEPVGLAQVIPCGTVEAMKPPDLGKPGAHLPATGRRWHSAADSNSPLRWRLFSISCLTRYPLCLHTNGAFVALSQPTSFFSRHLATTVLRSGDPLFLTSVPCPQPPHLLASEHPPSPPRESLFIFVFSHGIFSKFPPVGFVNPGSAPVCLFLLP